MKRLLRVITILLLSTSISFGQNEPVFYKSLEPDVLLKSLFNPSTVIKDRYGSKMAKWKPSPMERWSLPVNAQGWCYTEVDTVIRFQDERGGQQAVVVFASSAQPNNNGKRVAGAAKFSRAAPGWTISSFEIGLVEEYGGRAALVNFGKDHFALEVPGGDMGQGYLTSWSAYYDTDRFDKMLALITHEDNEGAVGKDDKGYYAYDVQVKFVQSTGEYYIAELKSHGTKATADSEKIVSANSVRTFHFDEFAGFYMSK